MSESDQYSDEMLSGMQTTYGVGFLSPGGAQETRQMVHGLTVANADVLDLGCGVGGAAMLLTKELGARRVTGVEVEEKTNGSSHTAGREQAMEASIDIEKIEPGPLPFAEASFDNHHHQGCDLPYLRPIGLLRTGTSLVHGSTNEINKR